MSLRYSMGVTLKISCAFCLMKSVSIASIFTSYILLVRNLMGVKKIRTSILGESITRSRVG